MLGTFRIAPMKGFLIKPVSLRHFSGAASIRGKFHQAWLENSQRAQRIEHRDPIDKAKYAHGYIQKNFSRMKKGYTHPYHSQDNPMIATSTMRYYKILQDLVGPEQVSPHYESLSRSRRGLIFMFVYLSTITSISRLGGWDFNEWVRGMLFHHEYLIALFVGFSEIRHFAWIPGPKFTVFYDVFSRYEFRQL